MSEDRDGQLSAARAYEELHVPALFQEWVEPVLDAAQVASGQRVLDIACGTGVLARAAESRVGSDGHVAGVDADEAMLGLAERIAPSVDWRLGTAESLPFADASFDRVVSQFGLMFFTDRRKAIQEALRVLIRGGMLAFAVWDSLENSPAYATEVELLERLAGEAAAEALRAPFALGDPGELAALFERAGAAGVSVTTRMGTARFPSIRSMVEADLRGWLPVMGVHLSEDQIATILEEADAALARFTTVGGQAVFDSPAHIVTAHRPSASADSA